MSQVVKREYLLRSNHVTVQLAFTNLCVKINYKIDTRQIIKVKQSHYMPGQAQEAEDRRFQDNRHRKVVRWSALGTGRL
jgi:hypothetical protein